MEGGTGLIDLMQQGGILMFPILLCSVVALAIIFERFWALQTKKIIPPKLSGMVRVWLKKNKLDAKKMAELKAHSPLGRVLAEGLKHSGAERHVLKDNIDAVVYHETHEMERYLNALGTVAAITPLLGLLGTVLGMIDVFSMIVLQGTGNATVLAGGISKALVTTAGGLFVAIPSLFFHRFLIRRIDDFGISLESEAMVLVDSLPADVVKSTPK